MWLERTAFLPALILPSIIYLSNRKSPVMPTLYIIMVLCQNIALPGIILYAGILTIDA